MTEPYRLAFVSALRANGRGEQTITAVRLTVAAPTWWLRCGYSG